MSRQLVIMNGWATYLKASNYTTRNYALNTGKSVNLRGSVFDVFWAFILTVNIVIILALFLAGIGVIPMRSVYEFIILMRV
jgi:hypothetical protein